MCEHHLRVLLDAGFLQRRRSGREVFYWWTEAAALLCTSAGAETRDGVPDHL